MTSLIPSRQPVIAALSAMALCSFCLCNAEEPRHKVEWQDLARGIELTRFPLSEGKPEQFVIVRVDARLARLKLLACAEAGHDALPADQWAKRHGVNVVINAGMFEPDHVSHTGFMKTTGRTHPDKLHKLYSSFAMFDPVNDKLPAFRILDADTEADMAGLQQSTFADYRSVLQNLRLIKRPAENRWKPQPKAWSEAALGEDKNGRALLIFCQAGLTMCEFNDRILKLPMELIAAQHLEGGPEASLYVKCGDFELRCMGSYETGFNENDGNHEFWPLPNVLSVKAGM
jgi:hypothetical protein